MTHALVTGSSGFIGSQLVSALQAAGWQVSAVSRTPDAAQMHLKDVVLDSVDVVFHLAGLAHDDATTSTGDDLMRTNANETEALFRACVAAGVDRFIWLSSIKVLGESAEQSLTVDAPRAPLGPYAESKSAGERALLATLQRESLDPDILAIVRPPLVYGPGVKANFLAMLRWSQSGWPLPLAGAQSPRAWVSVTNLTTFLMHIAMRDLGRQVVWHVCDDEQTPVCDMLQQMAQIGGVTSRLWTLPEPFLQALAAGLGKGGQMRRIFQPLTVDSSVSKTQLNWQPVQTQAQALEEVVSWYQTQR